MLVLGEGLDVEVWTGMNIWLESEPSLAPDGLLDMDVETRPDVIVEDAAAVEPVDD